MRRSVEVLLLIAILALGGGLRWLYLGEAEARPDFRHPAVDAGYHDYWARALVTGDWTPRTLTYDPEINRHPFFRPPGYPYFLAGIYRFIADDYRTPRLIQMFIGLASALLLFLLGRMLFSSATGLWAALLMSVYWVFIHFEGELLDASLLIFLTLAFLLVMSRFAFSPRASTGLQAGLLAGLTALVRPTILSFLPVCLLWMWWQHRSASKASPRWKTVGAFLLGLAFTLAPVAIRNWMVSGEFVLISANGGINLLIGNNPKADGTIGDPHTEPGVPFMNSDDYPVCVKAYERLWGRPTGYAEVSSYFSRKAVTYMREHPGRTLQLMWRKTLLFWGPAELGHQKELYFDRQASRVLSRLPISFPMLVALAIGGLVLGAARRKTGPDTPAVPGRQGAVVLLFLFTGVTFASLLFFFITAQYRVPAIPMLILAGAYGLARLPYLARRHIGWVLIWVATVVGSYAIASVNWVGLKPEPEKWYFGLGRAHEKEGQLADAAVDYRRALELNPFYEDALVNLGVLEAQAGHLSQAEGYFRRVIAIKPSAPAHVNLGRVLKMKGERVEARAEYEEALRVNPLHEVAHNNLGVLLSESGEWAEAERHLRTAIDIRPEAWPDPWINLADNLRRQKRFAEAQECYDRVLNKFPELRARLAPALSRLKEDQMAAHPDAP